MCIHNLSSFQRKQLLKYGKNDNKKNQYSNLTFNKTQCQDSIRRMSYSNYNIQDWLLQQKPAFSYQTNANTWATAKTTVRGILWTCTYITTDITSAQSKNSFNTVQQRKHRWIGHILRHDSLLWDTMEGRMLGKATRLTDWFNVPLDIV